LRKREKRENNFSNSHCLLTNIARTQMLYKKTVRRRKIPCSPVLYNFSYGDACKLKTIGITRKTPHSPFASAQIASQGECARKKIFECRSYN
jgi:hypothetical protein